MKKKRIAFAIWVALIVLLALSGLIINNIAEKPAPIPPITPAQVSKVTSLWDSVLSQAVAPPLGNSANRYTLVEFGDFQCPLCGHMEPKVYSFVADNPSHVSLYFVQLPLDVHPLARISAEAAQTAAAHGKFWPMYRILYANQLHLTPDYLVRYAAQAGVDPTVFREEMNEGKYMPDVMEGRNFSDDIGIPATPTFLMRDNKTGVVKMIVGKDFLKTIKNPPWLSGSKSATDGQSK